MSEIFRYKTKTPLSLSQEIFKPERTEDAIRIPFDNSKVVIYDGYRQIDDETVREGLVFDIFGETVEQSEARDLAKLFASVLSFSSKTEVPRPKLVQKIESVENQSKFEQRYALKEGVNQSMPPQLQEVDIELFKKVNDGLFSILNQDEDMYRELRRALRYYRKSLGEVRIEDQFTDLFIALDALRSRLYDHYISQNDPDDEDNDDWYGVRQFFKEFFSHDFDNGVYMARCELFHDGKTSEAVNHVDLLEEGVERTIFLLLDIDFEDYEQIWNKEAMRVGREPALFLRGDIENYDVPSSGVDVQIPHFDTDQLGVAIVPFRDQNGGGIRIDPDLGDFIELESDGYTNLEKGFGARGAGPEGKIQDLP